MTTNAQDPVTELAAVNILLGVVGQAPIATLDLSLIHISEPTRPY